MILAQLVTLSLVTSNYQHPAVDPGSIEIVARGNGFNIELQGADFYPYHFIIEADVPVRATYNFGGPTRFFFSPTGITDDESASGVFPIGRPNPTLPALYTIEPGTVTGRIEVDTLGVPAVFEVKQ